MAAGACEGKRPPARREPEWWHGWLVRLQPVAFMTIAVHDAQRDAVEQWARGCGFVMHSRTGFDRTWSDKRWGIHVNPLPPNHTLLICPDGDELRGHEVSSAVALAWAMLVELDAGPVDVGRCPVCVKRGGPMEWAQMSRDGRAEWNVAGPGWNTASHDWGWTATRPCLACNGTGRELIPAARLLLDVVSETRDARDILHAHADQLLANGDPAGMAIAWGLLWSEADGGEDGTGEAVLLLHWRGSRRRSASAKNGSSR